VFCANCGCLLVGEEFGIPGTPCPKCGSTTRRFDLYCEDGVVLSDHGMATTLRQGQPVGLTETERPDLTRFASLEPDGTIVLDLRGFAPRNEQDSDAVCAMLVAALNDKGGNLTLLGRGQADEDCVITDGERRLGIQVVRALTDPTSWARLARTGDVSLHVTVADAVRALKAAIEHKAAAIPPSQRPSLILALDSFRLPALALGPVVAEFRTNLSAWTRALGFRAVFVVGPESNFVARLDAPETQLWWV